MTDARSIKLSHRQEERFYAQGKTEREEGGEEGMFFNKMYSNVPSPGHRFIEDHTLTSPVHSWPHEG